MPLRSNITIAESRQRLVSGLLSLLAAAAVVTYSSLQEGGPSARSLAIASVLLLFGLLGVFQWKNRW